MRSLHITYEDGLTQRSRCLREHLLVQVHQRGLVNVAGQMDLSPSKLSEKLSGQDSGGKPRGMTIDELESYIRTQHDVSPIHYLIERYLISAEATQAEALAKIHNMLNDLSGALGTMGVKWP